MIIKSHTFSEFSGENQGKNDVYCHASFGSPTLIWCTLDQLNARASWFIVKILKRWRRRPSLPRYCRISAWKGLVCQDFGFLLFQVELVEYLHSALQDLIYIVHTIRITFHGQIDERDLKRDHVLWWHVLARLKRNQRMKISLWCLKSLFETSIWNHHSWEV